MIGEEAGMRRRVLIHLCVILLFFLAGVVFTWPAAARLERGIWGRTWDATNNLWFFGHLRYLLMSDQDVFSLTTHRVFYPFGYDLRADLAHFLLPFLSVPLQGCRMTEAGAYNLLLLFSFAFSGWAAYLLARRFAAGRVAALLAGLLWLINPVTVRELAAGRIEVACTGFLLLAFLALLRLREKPTVGRAAWLFVAWYLTGLTNWVMAGMFGLAMLAITAVSFRALPVKRERLRFLALAGGCLLLTGLAAWPLLGPLVEGERLSIDESDVSLSRLLPEGETPDRLDQGSDAALFSLVNDSLDPGDFFVAQDAANPAAPLAWWLIFTAALLSLADRERRNGWLLALGFGFLLLACGPYLRWFDRFYYGPVGSVIPMPAWLLYKLVPGFHLFYRPYRFVFPALLLLVGPTAVGLEVLLRLTVKPAAKCLLASGLALFSLSLGLLCFQGSNAFTLISAPTEYLKVIKPLHPRALLEVPFFPFPTSQVNAEAMLAQSLHGANIFNATLLREASWKRLAALVADNSLLGALLDLQLKRPGPYRVRTQDANRLAEMGFDLLLVHTSYFESEPDADRYRRLPHEVFYLLDTLYGAPQELQMGRLYRPTTTATANVVSAPAPGEVTVPAQAVTRLYFARQYFRPGIYREPVGYVSLTVGDEERSNALAVSVPQETAGATELRCWLRYHTGQQPPKAMWLEFGYGAPGQRPAWRLALPWVEKLAWQWCRLRLADLQTASGEPFAPERVGWLRLVKEGGEQVIVDLDDMAFCR